MTHTQSGVAMHLEDSGRLQSDRSVHCWVTARLPEGRHGDFADRLSFSSCVSRCCQELDKTLTKTRFRLTNGHCSCAGDMR